MKNEARYNLKIVDTDGGSGATQPRQQDDDYQARDEDTTAVDEPADKSVEEPTPEAVENTASEYEEKHRKDLADLDDLDI